VTIFILLILGTLGVLIGRFAFGRWFNHVSLYTAIWGSMLGLFEIRLINYYPLQIETWIIIAVGWFAFMAGSLTVTVARRALGSAHEREDRLTNPLLAETNLRRVKTILLSLNIVSFLAAAHSLYIVSQMFGGLTNALALGNLLYSYRVLEGLPGAIPYLSSLVFPAALLGGYYTSRSGKLTLVALLPLLVVIMVDIANMGRANIFVGGFLFSAAYFLTPRMEIAPAQSPRSKFRRFAVLLIVAIIVAGGAELVRSSRKPTETFAGSTRTLLNLRTASFITPSIYLYFSSHFGVLNQYLKHGGENTPIGGHTFSSVYKILEKLGFDTHVETYQTPYRTPVRTNTGTYLRELHGDFGIPGLIIGPFVLGLLTSIFWYRVLMRQTFVDLAIAALLFVIVGMSGFVMATRIGALVVYVIGAIFVCSILDRQERTVSVKVVYG
jgi:oligosaccharide repeat unit polymerase